MNNKKRLYIYHTFLSRRKDLGQFHSIKELINQLDYIESMGFNAILTNPIMQSSDDSHGYYTTCYYDVDSRLGTMKDFEELLRELEKRDMKFCIDITMAHCSDQSFYYKDWIKGKNNFFVAEDYPINDISSDMKPTKYEYRPSLNKHLVCAFDGFIPNLNVKDKDVQNEMKRVIQYWLKKSPNNIIFRLDGILHNRVNAINNDGLIYCRQIREWVNEINPECVLIGEVWDNSSLLNRAKEYGEVLGNVFDFYNTFSVVNQIRAGRGYDDIYIDNSYKSRRVMFTSNHDCSRLMSMLDNDVNKVKLFLDVLVNKTDDNTDLAFYYGFENNMTGYIEYEGGDLNVRKNMDIFDMARVIQDKDSLFYYIKDLIKKDKERRGIK